MLSSRPPALVAVLGVALAAACGGSAFVCEQPGDCNDGEQAGTCEPNGWCSFPDPSCESGARYGEHAGEGLAGQCVDGEIATSSGDPDSSATTATTATTASTSSTTSPTTTASTTSVDTTETTTDDPTGDTATPVCGDGNVEGEEECDDDNLVAGDGCSPDCVASGSIIWSRTIDGEGNDEGHTLDRFANGDLAVGFVFDQGVAARPGVARIDQAGADVWQWGFSEVDWVEAYTWGLDVAGLDDTERIIVAVDGSTPDGIVAGVAGLNASGSGLWFDTQPNVTLFAAAIQPTGLGYVAGRDYVTDIGVVIGYDVAGTVDGTASGEPFTPNDGYAFDLVVDGDVFFLAGLSGPPGERIAFLGASVGGIVTRHEFAPSTYNEGLAVALDPNEARRWIAGYAEDQGGWVGAADPQGITLDATIVTNVFSANLHGIAIDPSGAAIAVGWDSEQGTRDAFVVKVAPDGTRIWWMAFATANGDDDLRDVEVTSDGSIFVVGTRVDEMNERTAWLARLVP